MEARLTKICVRLEEEQRQCRSNQNLIITVNRLEHSWSDEKRSVKEAPPLPNAATLAIGAVVEGKFLLKVGTEREVMINRLTIPRTPINHVNHDKLVTIELHSAPADAQDFTF